MTLRKGLSRLDGVADAKLTIKPPLMRVRMKPGAWPDLPKMLRTVREAGFTPIEDGVELTVSGKVVRLGDGFALELDRMKSPVTLRVVAAPANPEAVAHLERHLDQVVELEGGWRPPAGDGGPGSLLVTAVLDAASRHEK